MVKLTDLKRFLVIVLLGLYLGPLLGMSSADRSSRQANPDTLPANVVEVDTAGIVGADSSNAVGVDTVHVGQPADNTLVSKLFFPVLLTGLLGGLLYLLYTQRGN